MQLLTAALALASLPARTASLGPAPNADHDSKLIEYYDLDPFEPMFALEAGPDGSMRYRTRRPLWRRDQSFAAKKPEGRVRVFLIGGSVAGLFDTTETGPLVPSLQALFGGREVEIVNCGSSGYDSSRDALVVREILEYEPDLVVLMSGINDPKPLPLEWIGRACSRFRGSTLVMAACRGALRLNQRVGSASTRYRRFLREMIGRASGRGVPFVVCTLPVNLRDMPPKGVLPVWDASFAAPWVDLENGRWQAAESGFLAYESSHARDVMSRYFRGRTLDRMGRYDEALAVYESVLAASDGRNVPDVNADSRRIAREFDEPLGDVAEAFGSASPHGLVGWNLMEDDVHWDREADPLVAAVIAHGLRDWMSRHPGSRLGSAEGGSDTELSRALKAAGRMRPGRRRSWLVFKVRAWDMGHGRRGGDELFTERLIALLELIGGAHPELLESMDGLKGWLKDRLRGNVWDDFAAAGLDGWWPTLLAHVGETLRRKGEPAEAVRYFELALRAQPSLPGEVRVAKALAHWALGQSGQARTEASLAGRQAESPGARLRLERAEAAAPAVALPARRARRIPFGRLVAQADPGLRGGDEPIVDPDVKRRVDEAVDACKRGELEKCGRILDRALSEEPANIEARLTRAWLEARRGDAGGAAADYRAVLGLPDLKPELREAAEGGLTALRAAKR
jgi:tetratricopeptide (TPR) repeat protein